MRIGRRCRACDRSCMPCRFAIIHRITGVAHKSNRRRCSNHSSCCAPSRCAPIAGRSMRATRCRRRHHRRRRRSAARRRRCLSNSSFASAHVRFVGPVVRFYRSIDTTILLNPTRARTQCRARSRACRRRRVMTSARRSSGCGARCSPCDTATPPVVAPRCRPRFRSDSFVDWSITYVDDAVCLFVVVCAICVSCTIQLQIHAAAPMRATSDAAAAIKSARRIARRVRLPRRRSIREHIINRSVVVVVVVFVRVRVPFV